MELKDNFTKRYFREHLAGDYNSSVKNYVDLVNQPTSLDVMADSFRHSGSGQASNPGERLNNITLDGFGAGLQSVATDQRQEKLSPILEQAGEINAQAAYLQAQYQQMQAQEMETQQFLTNQSLSFMELAKASGAGDIDATNNIARGILQYYKQVTADPLVGDFDHYYDGTIYYVNNDTGDKSGLSIPQLIAQSGIPPEQIFGADYPMVMSAFSPGFKSLYENSLKAQELALEKEKAGIGKTYAETELLGGKNAEIQNQLANPEMSKMDEFTTKANLEYLDNLNKSIQDKSIPLKIQVLDRLEEILKAENSAGSTPLKALQRWAKTISGTDEKLTEARLLQKYFFPDIKGVAGNPNSQEWSDLVSRIVSTSQNVDAALDIINFEREQAENTLAEYDAYSNILSKNTNNLSYHHPDIKNQVEAYRSNKVQNQQPENTEEVFIKWD